MLGDAVMRVRQNGLRVATMLGVCALSIGAGACGPGVRTKVANAMAGCLAVRNPLFKAGRADEALATKLPPAIDSLADQTAYAFGFIVYQETADEAQTQAELTCALELGSHYEHDDVRAWLKYFGRSPNPPVAALAKRLYEAQFARIGKPVPASP